MDPEIASNSDTEEPKPAAAPRTCEDCGSTDLSITPVPGLWLQYWCNACDHWWWETREGKPLKPDPA